MAEILQNLGVNWKLLMAQLINFGLLLFLLNRFLYKPLAGFMEKRSLAIEQGLKNAKEAEEKLAKANLEKEQIILKAQKEAEHILAKARQIAEQNKAKIEQQARQESERIIKEAKQEIFQDKERLLDQIKKETVLIALGLAEKILRECASGSLSQEQLKKKLQEIKI